jgi:ATP-dependent Zn protease
MNESLRELADLYLELAQVLLVTGVERDFTATVLDEAQAASTDARLYKYLRDYRPTVAIETPYRDLRVELAQLVAKACGVPPNLTWETSNPVVQQLGKKAELVLLTEATFGRGEVEALSLLGPIVRGPHIALLVVERVDSLPQDVRDIIDLQISIPRMDDILFWDCTGVLFSEPIGDQRKNYEWLRYVLPRDMARAAAATAEVERYIHELEATITRRLLQYTAPDSPSLHELEGMGEARYRMEELAADMRAASRGEIQWDQVDRGYLLVGPPGTGKTTLVKALAKDCGVRFVLASAGRWQEGETLGPHIQNIRRTFREARLYAPSILFIDEIDSLGSRVLVEARNSQYQTVVINTVLEEMDGFKAREGVVVIGATNNPDSVDEALRRPGRLDRLVELPYPNVAALGKIYDFYLARAAKEGLECDKIDTLRLGKLTFGRTGAHVELYVRGAIRRVRREGRRAITEQDIVAEITNRPPDGYGRALTEDAMRRVAVHEAGHALVTLTGPFGDRDITMISITPRSDGTMGFVARSPEDLGYVTRDMMEENVRIILGGRAAEEIMYGPDRISCGAGGTAVSDLAKATQNVLRMLTEFGFSKSGGLFWLEWQARGNPSEVTAEAIRNLPKGNEILNEARETIDRLYGEARERLAAHRGALDRIVELLIERQELAPDELRGVLSGSDGRKKSPNRADVRLERP